jgi:hypothetical protein
MKYSCSKCGRDFSRENNKNMHEKYCNGVVDKIEKKKITGKLPVKKKITGTGKKTECPKSKTGLHDLIIMRNTNPIYAKAMSEGYTAYCRICKELI